MQMDPVRTAVKSGLERDGLERAMAAVEKAQKEKEESESASKLGWWVLIVALLAILGGRREKVSGGER